jgi:hypothetical protein
LSGWDFEFELKFDFELIIYIYSNKRFHVPTLFQTFRKAAI